MSEMSSVQSEAGSARRVWCPFCGGSMGVDTELDQACDVRCPRCGGAARLDHVLAESQWRDYEAALREYVASLRQQSDALLAQATRSEAEARHAHVMAERTRWAARAAGTGRSDGARILQSPASPRRRSVPVSLLLQGTGALLLLAALTAGSAVLWGSLPASAQATLLFAMVAAVGTLAVWLGRRLPTTGAVLAVLTAAAGIVVASALPQILGGLDGRWYPTVASLLGALILLVAGRAFAVQLWWLAGLLVTAASAGLVISTVLAWTNLEPMTLLWYVTAVVLILPLAVASLAVGRVAEGAGDPETARTVTWIGSTALAAAVAVLAMAGASWLVALGHAAATVADRGAVAGATLAAAAAVRWAARGSRAMALASAGLVGAIPAVLVIPSAPFGVSQALLCAAAPLLVLAATTWVAARRPGLRAPAAILVVSLSTTSVIGLAAATLEVGVADFGWLVALLWGLGGACAAAGYGLATAGAGWLVVAAVLQAGTWAAVWSAGHLAGTVESLVLPIAGFLLGVWLLGSVRGLLAGALADPSAGQVLLLVAAAPSTVASWNDQLEGELVVGRLLFVVATVGGVALWSALARTGWTVPVLGAATVALGYTVTALTTQWPEAPAEAYSVAVAVALLAVLLAGFADGWATSRTAVMAALLVAVVPSVVLLLADPVWGAATALRLTWTTAVIVPLLVLQWKRPRRAWMLGTVLVVLPLWVYEVHWWEQDGALLELATAPIALAAGVSTALAARAVPGWSPPVAGLRVGFWLLLLPSLAAVLIHLDPVSDAQAMRMLAVLAAAGALAVLTDRRAGPDTLVAGSLVVVLGWLLVLRMALDRGWVVEGLTLPTGVAIALVAGWVTRPATRAAWWRLGRWPLAAVLLLSTAWTLTVGMLPSSSRLDWLRAGSVVAVWAAAALLSWASPRWAALFGSIAVVVLAVQVVSLLGTGRADPAVELATWPAAAALGVVSWLVWRAAGGRGPSLVWVGPPVALAVLPTAGLAWADGTAGWRAWFGLLVGAAVLLAGVRVSWAGLVVPGLLSVAMVAVPVLLHYASDAPVWVPMTIAGALLIVVGARLEATRREGHRLIDWAVHLH